VNEWQCLLAQQTHDVQVVAAQYSSQGNACSSIAGGTLVKAFKAKDSAPITLSPGTTPSSSWWSSLLTIAYSQQVAPSSLPSKPCAAY